MNNGDLALAIAKRTRLDHREVATVLSVLADEVATALAHGDKVSLSGLFIAEVAQRAERTGRNPRTGEPLVIPAAQVVRLRPAAALKRAVS